MTRQAGMDVWVLSNIPSPYQVDLLRAVHKDGRCRLDVRWMRKGNHEQDFQSNAACFPSAVMKGWGPKLWAGAFQFHPQAVRECRAGKMDVVVLSGQYTSLTFLACAVSLAGMRKGRKRGPRVLYWLEPPWPETFRPAWSGRVSSRLACAAFVRHSALRWLLRRADGLMAIGQRAVEAYCALGVPRERVWDVPYHIEVSRFRQVDQAVVRQARAERGWEKACVFLFSGQLIPRKGVDLLLSAFSRVAGRRDDVALLVLGDGPMRRGLEGMARKLGVGSKVKFEGHVRQADLPLKYAMADVFVFPTRYDGWGVVLNEACASGLPIIATEAAGAAAELVREGENGFVVKRDDEDAIAGKMLFFADRPDVMAGMRQASLAIAEEYSVKKGVERFVAACNKVLDLPLLS